MRSTADLLERRRKAEADLRPASYVRPAGRGFHVVRLQDGTEYTVGAGQGSTTYAPGQVVTVATYSGSRDRVIATGPAPGRRGGSLVQSQYRETVRRQPRLLGAYPMQVPVGVDTPGYIWGYNLLGYGFEYYIRPDISEPVYEADTRAVIFGEAFIPDLDFKPSADISFDADTVSLPAATWAAFGAVGADDIVVDEEDAEGNAVADPAAYMAIIYIDTEGETIELAKGEQVADGIAPPMPEVPTGSDGSASIPWVSIIRRAGGMDTGGTLVQEIPAYESAILDTQAGGGQDHIFCWFRPLLGQIEDSEQLSIREEQ